MAAMFAVSIGHGPAQRVYTKSATHADPSKRTLQNVMEKRMNTAATTPVTPVSNNNEDANATTMQVRKRDGSLEPVDVNKIVRAVARSGQGLENIDVLKIATKTIGGL